VALIGGAKVSSKIAVLESLLGKVDRLIIGGGMAYTFLKAKGLAVGGSLVEDDMVETAGKILQKAEEKKISLSLPVDHIVAAQFSADAEPRHVASESISGSDLGMDIGPLTIEKFNGALKGAKTVLWNGPVGVFEFPKFASGTVAMAKTISELPNCVTVIGGGDSVSAVNKAGVADKMSHISTGGGASLELIEGKELPGVAALKDKKPAAGWGGGCR
jgi:phosphoglycerate kinase